MHSRTTAEKRAYVLIDAEPGRAVELTEILRMRTGVAAADVIDGPYSIIVVAEGTTVSAVAKIVLVDIMRLNGVKDVIVYMASPEATALSRRNERATATGQ